MKGLIIRLRFVQLSLQNTREIFTGQIVGYRGFKWVVRSDAHRPKYVIANLESDVIEQVDLGDLTLDKSWNNLWVGFKATYGFYMDCWYPVLRSKPLKVAFRRPFFGWLQSN